MRSPALPEVGVVVLTQGTRPEDLDRGLRSVLAQEGVSVNVVVVGNGWTPTGLPEGVGAVALPENLGIPAGRNRGALHVHGEFLFFLDDDAWLPKTDFLASAVATVRADPRIGLIQPRLTDPTGTPAPRHWTPRIRKGDPAQSSDIFVCLEAAVFLPRRVFDATGGWADPFFYAHEGIELVWRVWNTGHTARYEADLSAHHPVVEQTRHTEYYRMNARNRVWLARRNLPLVLVPIYVATWTGIQILRWWRRPAQLKAWFAGWREGWRTSPGPRSPMRWRTVLRMSAAGRPPVI